MSKFFAGLEDAPQKKVNSAIAAQLNFSDDSEEDKPTISNKEKKDEEVDKLCKETTFKKPKDVDQFFKKLTKYSAHFTKKGLPSVLVDFIAEAEKNKSTPAIFKQKKTKFLEKYNEVEVILNVVEEKKHKKSYIEEIGKTYLIENLQKRKEALKEMESISTLSDVEMHRINLYLLSCIIEESVEENYVEIIDRLKKEKNFVSAEEEQSLLRTRIGKYMRNLLKYVQELDADKINWENVYYDLMEVAEGLSDVTDVPRESVLEIDYFLRSTVDDVSRPYLTKEFIDRPIDSHNYEKFKVVEKLRDLPILEAVTLYKQLTEKENSTNAHLPKCAEELGHRAFIERDFTNAMDLLEYSYYNKTLWCSAKTETVLRVLCLCFEQKMKEREFFSVFKKSLLQIGDNLLLLKSQSIKMEIARAFVFLRLGSYLESHAIITEILPGFNCETLLRTRAIELLLTPQ
ncbi:hypothetical protein NEPAR04_0445 [Nematocida parisii]|nr:hypothetical protein NEPAR03_0467 [Nematocida parisii]KAI5126465.1 hypothetical protein NEPAR08_0456 [Nematocida parisii]KAI5140710.1 hypothetical protein NEPAR04_0445 [Nematocida parisii]